jgi:hypothetical protein
MIQQMRPLSAAAGPIVVAPPRHLCARRQALAMLRQQAWDEMILAPQARQEE